MKVLLFLVFPFFACFTQSNGFPLKEQDFREVILNGKLGYEGEISDRKSEVMFETVTKDSGNPEMYLVKGSYTIDGKT